MLEIAEAYLQTGGSYKQVAAQLDTSQVAVGSHLRRVREYTGLHSTFDACNMLLYGRVNP